MHTLVFTKNTRLEKQINKTIKIRNFDSRMKWDFTGDIQTLYNLTDTNAVHSVYIDSATGIDDTIMMVSYILKTNPFSRITVLGCSDITPTAEQITKLFKSGVKNYFPFPWDMSDLISDIENSISDKSGLSSGNLIFIDDLTGLYNTRYLYFKLEKELKKALEKDTCFAILFIDIDNFKSVNDTYGHIVASTVLNLIGRFIRENTRETDLVFRYGGDEFVVMLETTDSEKAFHVAERLRKVIENKHFLIKTKHKLKLTVSIGIASFPEDGKTTVDIMEMADQAMYAGKKTTKNVVYTAKKLLYNE
ncbi:MAG: GGDEF domain-containing protein [Oligoflexia bacterium]|nr:GGDEF domain-containing protein [Oligoflexia bacterium]